MITRKQIENYKEIEAAYKAAKKAYEDERVLLIAELEVSSSSFAELERKESMRFNSQRFRKDFGDVYDRYKEKSVSLHVKPLI